MLAVALPPLPPPPAVAPIRPGLAAPSPPLPPAPPTAIALFVGWPMHAAALAGELRIRSVILPPAPGAFSALGLVASDLRRDYSRTFYADVGSTDLASLVSVI